MSNFRFSRNAQRSKGSSSFCGLSLAATVFALSASAGVAQADVIYDNYRGEAGLLSGSTPIKPNYKNNGPTYSPVPLDNLIAFAYGGNDYAAGNMATEGATAPNIAWYTNDEEGLCNAKHHPDTIACENQWMGRVVYAIIRFPEAGEYTFHAAHDDQIQLDFDKSPQAADAANFRELNYETFGRLLEWGSSAGHDVGANNGPRFTFHEDGDLSKPVKKLSIPQAGTRYAMRIYWNNVGNHNYLRLKWTRPGADEPETIAPNNLFDPSNPGSYHEPSVAPVPTLGEWGLMLMAGLAAAMGAMRLRRSRA